MTKGRGDEWMSRREAMWTQDKEDAKIGLYEKSGAGDDGGLLVPKIIIL